MTGKIYIGIDNGASGSIGIIFPDGTNQYLQMPSFSEQDYTKKAQQISRVDWRALTEILPKPPEGIPMLAVIERPFVNPGMFSTTTKAVRALEAVLIVLESLGIPRMIVDSKAWQKVMLPTGLKGAPEMKKASKDIGCRLFPQHEAMIKKQKDADGILMAEWARRASL